VDAEHLQTDVWTVDPRRNSTHLKPGHEDVPLEAAGTSSPLFSLTMRQKGGNELSRASCGTKCMIPAHDPLEPRALAHDPPEHRALAHDPLKPRALAHDPPEPRALAHDLPEPRALARIAPPPRARR
jgi:hypothetical protein